MLDTVDVCECSIKNTSNRKIKQANHPREMIIQYESVHSLDILKIPIMKRWKAWEENWWNTETPRVVNIYFPRRQRSRLAKTREKLFSDRKVNWVLRVEFSLPVLSSGENLFGLEKSFSLPEWADARTKNMFSVHTDSILWSTKIIT